VNSLEFLSVSEENKDEVVEFLQEVSLAGDINEEALLNGELVYDKQIIGTISFEEFNDNALIRYFIFRQPINDEVVLELFDRITRKARNKQIKSLIAIVVKREARAVFKRIGFYEIVSDDVYIDEVNLNETKFKNAVVLKYDLT
jgi:N-acetylglutamate synthase-like GNAT family acetyltransferase